MPRPPNYDQERKERDRQKAAKKAEKVAEKQAAKAARDRLKSPEDAGADATEQD